MNSVSFAMPSVPVTGTGASCSFELVGCSPRTAYRFLDEAIRNFKSAEGSAAVQPTKVGGVWFENRRGFYAGAESTEVDLDSLVE